MLISRFLGNSELATASWELRLGLGYLQHEAYGLEKLDAGS